MKKIRAFKTVENETTKKENDTLFTISCLCDSDGSFEICITGTGGSESAIEAVRRVAVMIK